MMITSLSVVELEVKLLAYDSNLLLLLVRTLIGAEVVVICGDE